MKPSPSAVTPKNPRIPVLDRIAIFEGTFVPEGGTPFVVETPLTGDSRADRQSLVNLARSIVPAGRMKLASTRIFTRDPRTAASFPKGVTLGQLFGEQGSASEVSVEIGHVFFQGERCLVMLRNLRSRNSVTIALRPPGGGQIVFSNQLESNRLATELTYLVKEILGNDARELTITIRIEQ